MPQFSQFSTLANSGDQPPAAEHVSLENVPPPHTHQGLSVTQEVQKNNSSSLQPLTISTPCTECFE